MVHFWDTSALPSVNKFFGTEKRYIPSAFFTMMRSGWFYSFAFLAPPHPLLHFQSFSILVPLLSLYSKFLNPSFSSWVNGTSPVVAPPYPEHEDIKPCCFFPAQGARLDVVEEELGCVCKEDDKY